MKVHVPIPLVGDCKRIFYAPPKDITPDSLFLDVPEVISYTGNVTNLA